VWRNPFTINGIDCTLLSINLVRNYIGFVLNKARSGMGAEFMQPGLVQLQPTLDDFMDTFEPLQGSQYILLLLF
jgi:hypothetical protein